MTTLYKKAKTGKTQIWNITTEGPELITIYGELNGKLQEARRVCEPKNVGRSNETTAAEQAKLEMESEITKQLRKGYFKSVGEAQDNTVFLPMLAASYEKRKDKIQFPIDGQPKLNGVRCLAYYKPGGPGWQLMSRGGKSYNAPAIIADLKQFGDTSFVYDGELYIHELALQDIVSIIKNPESDQSALRFRIYDIFKIQDLEKTWPLRRIQLQEQNRFFRSSSTLSMVSTRTNLNNEKDIEELHTLYVSQGYEGLILRDTRGTYELGKRSNYLIKYKKFQTEEFEIVDFTDGVGKFVGCVVWICKTLDNSTFKVVPKGTIEQKKEWFSNGTSYIGKFLTVQFQELTNEKIPQFPVGITIRDYE